jgi:hypothetical protein
VSAVASWTSSASAHHGIANFDLNADIALEGVVTDVRFINPHSWLYLDVTAADGQVTAWRCEMRGATVLRRSGWSPDMFPAGMQIRVTGSPDRREPATCYLGTAIFPDGSSVDRYGQMHAAPPQAPVQRVARLPDGTDPRGQSGSLVPISTADEYAPGGVPAGGAAFPGSRGTAISLQDDPVDAFWNRRPSMLPLTAAGAAVMENFDGSSTDNPRLRCEPTNIMFDWTFETDVNRITQTDREIRMYYGSMGIERVIDLAASDHPSDIVPSRAGHSIGRWDGDTLVVDTIGFLPGIVSADGRLPHGEGLHVVERFTLDAEGGALDREYVAEDPAFFEGRFTGRDVVLVSDLPYAGTAECLDMTHGEAAAAASPGAQATPQAVDPEAAPWWMFWKWW